MLILSRFRLARSQKRELFPPGERLLFENDRDPPSHDLHQRSPETGGRGPLQLAPAVDVALLPQGKVPG